MLQRLVTPSSSRANEASTSSSPQSSLTFRSPSDEEEAELEKEVEEEIRHHEPHRPPVPERPYDPFEVRFDPEDPIDPHTWSRLKRWVMTAIAGLLVLNATFASTATTGMAQQLEEHFGFGSEVVSLLISLFVAGYIVGPLVWAPLSEQYGRRPIFLITFIIYTGFQVGSALSPNTGSLLVFRFLGGVFSAAPLTNSGAVISDMWDPSVRGKAMSLFSLAPFAGPCIAPIASGYMAVAGVSWRWIMWLLTFFAGACLLLILFLMPETYAPILLAGKARKLRKETGDTRYMAPIEREHKTFWKWVYDVVFKPLKLLFVEPMLLAICVYQSFIYGCIYLLFEAYPIVFIEGYGFNPGEMGLMFLPIFIGGVIAVLAYLFYWNPRYVRAVAKYKPRPVPPEYRLEYCMFAAPCLVLAFFWFGWTSYPRISFWSPAISGVPMGLAIVLIFLSLFNYIIDAYLVVAASALAANTVMRSCFGAGFPLFARQMYETLNPRWASTLLGLLATILAPIPFVLRRYGPDIRRKSKYAPSGDDGIVIEEKKAEEKKKDVER